MAYCPAGSVLSEDGHAPLPRHASLRHRSSVADLLDRVVKSLLRSSSIGQVPQTFRVMVCILGGGDSSSCPPFTLPLPGCGHVVCLKINVVSFCTPFSLTFLLVLPQASHAGGYFAAQGDDPRRNVLSLGCRVAGPQATSELLSVQGVACAFPNTTVNVIRSPPWEQLTSRIGDDLMFALLRQHALFQRLPNRCFMQVSFESSLCSQILHRGQRTPIPFQIPRAAYI